MLRHLINRWLYSQATRRVQEELRGGSPATSPPAEARGVDVAVLFALPIEAGGLVARLTGVVTERPSGFVVHEGGLHGRRVQIVVTGPGREQAARAATGIIAAYHPGWVVSAGLAGGLRSQLAKGDLLAVTSLVDGRTGERLHVDLRMESRPGLHIGRLITVDRLVTSQQEKQELASRYDALGVDLESFAVAQICQQTQTRFLGFRAISDGVADRLPDEVGQWLKQKSWAGKCGAVTGALVRRPKTIQDFWRLRETALLASERLATFLAAVLPALPADDPADVESPATQQESG